jgi:DNA-directed RNA polymerase subunit RPC12/RpoP
MKCTNCGREVPDTAKVCGYCGHRLKEVSPASAPTPVSVSPPPSTVKAKTPAWLWGLIVVLVLLGGAIAGGAILADRIRAGIATPIPAAATTVQPAVKPAAPADTQEILPTVTPTRELEPAATATTKPVDPPASIMVESFEDSDPAAFIADLATEAGSNTWTVKITSDLPVKINWGWCAATQAILDQNLEHMQILFYVDGKDVTSSMSPISRTIEGGVCQNFRGIIRSWPAGQHIVFYKMVFLEKVNDGEKDYEGVVTKTFNVNVTP